MLYMQQAILRDMDHLFRTKPSFHSIIDKQRAAHHRLNSETTRTEPEKAHYRRTLQPVPLQDVTVPSLPLVRPRAAGEQGRYLVVGELAQMPGRVVLIDVDSGSIAIHYTAD